VPAVRTCITDAEPGMVVESERGFPSSRYDLLAALDHIYRHQLDYQRGFYWPAFMTSLYVSIVRRLAASNKLPDKQVPFGPVRDVHCDVLIVGPCISGSAAFEVLKNAGLNVVLADGVPSSHRDSSRAIGYYEQGEVGVQTDRGLDLVTSRAVLLATGTSESGLTIPNADLPGVLLPAALRDLASRGVAPGSRAVVIGSGDLLDSVTADLETLRIRFVKNLPDASSVSRIVGGHRVEAVDVVRVSGKTTRYGCDIVIMLGTRAPSVELAHQAGCRLVSRDGVWCLMVDEDFRTSVPSVFGCGSVTGIWDPKALTASGERAARSILRTLGAT
jgi:NADPH-dependent 2,4-dienoyl-CoA reductase/sulfur reductase-like enzyme